MEGHTVLYQEQSQHMSGAWHTQLCMLYLTCDWRSQGYEERSHVLLALKSLNKLSLVIGLNYLASFILF